MGVLDTETAKRIGSIGGKARAENIQKQKEAVEGMSFEEIVNEYTTGKDLLDLYKGLMASGKKGSVKATETILKYLEKKKEDVKDNEFSL